MNRRVTVFGSRLLALAAVVVLSACGGSSGSSTATTDSVPTTDVSNDGPVYPLLGTPMEDSAAASRPAMVVKIDNHPSARPQAGINQADIIFEENVEKLTRYAAVFHSEGSDPVGPIRSGRFQDINMVGSLNKPLFVWSGGNSKVSSAIGKSDYSSKYRNQCGRVGRQQPAEQWHDITSTCATSKPTVGWRSPCCVRACENAIKSMRVWLS